MNRLISSAIILSMGDEPKFDYGEMVRITAKEHKGSIGAVVGISGQECSRTYTVEFGDGSDSEIAEELL
jgi:ribosomal protein S4E